MIRLTPPLPDSLEQAFRTLEEHYLQYPDPWGLNVSFMKRLGGWFWPLYHNYFRVQVFNSERIPYAEPLIVVSNHSGQIAIDGVLIGMSFLIEGQRPRILRSMVERFLGQMPFLGKFVAEIGGVLGDRSNASYLLQRKESLLVFPEGLKGISKNTSDFYHMSSFTQGFFRLAMKEKVTILPVAVVGAEEFYPWVYHLRGVAKKLSLPVLPVTPFFPLFGPLGLLPLPSPVDIHIGKPYIFGKDFTANHSDEEVAEHVQLLKRRIATMIRKGLKQRRPCVWAASP